MDILSPSVHVLRREFCSDLDELVGEDKTTKRCVKKFPIGTFANNFEVERISRVVGPNGNRISRSGRVSGEVDWRFVAVSETSYHLWNRIVSLKL